MFYDPTGGECSCRVKFSDNWGEDGASALVHSPSSSSVIEKSLQTVPFEADAERAPISAG